VRLYPAIDILEGNAVRLVRGDFDARKVYDADPLAAATAWVKAGAEALHVVDLDGARSGEPVNFGELERIAKGAGVPVQYGGGLRSAEAVRAALAAGAMRVIVGTAAFTDRGLLVRLLDEHSPEQVLVAVDVRNGMVATHGWLERTTTPAEQAFADLRAAGVRGFVYTNVDRDGTLAGAGDGEVAAAARAVGDGQVIVSGGIGGLDDLRALARIRDEQQLDALDGVIVGTALYERRFTIGEAREALAPS
jgi:phosphoribosylformimino-5-aminoimidazole carboxamide ribotide isomerase